MGSRLICVTDTNVWIDLHVGGILEKVFTLPFSFISPDVVVGELKEPDGRSLVSMGLKSLELTGEQVLYVRRIARQYPGPSRVDLFALVLAKDLNVVLLTGDLHLRKAATAEKVVVHGTLWLLDQLVKYKILEPIEAIGALAAMRKNNSRLPRIECEKRIKCWELLGKKRKPDY